MFIDIFGLDAVTSNPTVQLCFFCAVKKMGYGRNEREMGLWIVVGDWNDPFSYGCKTAGWTNSVRGKANYRGAFESSFVAHAHTHPTRYNGALRSGPAPGVNDIDMADQLQRDGYSYPVYTISPEGVWKYDPKTNQTTQELSANWTTPIKKCGKECEKMDQHGGIY